MNPALYVAAPNTAYHQGAVDAHNGTAAIGVAAPGSAYLQGANETIKAGNVLGSNTTTPGLATSTTGSSTPAGTPMSQSVIDAIQQGINNAIAQHLAEYNNANAVNQANTQSGINEHTQAVNQNNQTHEGAISNAEQAAARGNQGLRSVLASMGALNGTGGILAGRAVADSANNDIGTADQTYQTNAMALDKAQKDFLNSAGNRDTALLNARNQDDAASRQNGYQQILNQANSLGDKTTYQKYLPLAAGDTPTPVSMNPTQVVYNPANVNSYAPNSGLTVGVKAPTSTTAPVNSVVSVKKAGATA